MKQNKFEVYTITVEGPGAPYSRALSFPEKIQLPKPRFNKITKKERNKK